MSVYSIVLLLLFWSFHLGESRTDYCFLHCGSTPHTVCKKKWKCGPQPGCIHIYNANDNNTFRIGILRGHNNIRNRIALGTDQILGTGWPPGANMHTLNYDMELEFLAKCWANSCPGEAYDPCRRSSFENNIGQLILKSDTTELTSEQINGMLFEAVLRKDLLYPRYVLKYNHHVEKLARGYAHIAWADTFYIGCSRSKRVGERLTYVYCNYDVGPVYGRSIYKPGKPCSMCNKLILDKYKCQASNDRFLALCGAENYFTMTSGATIVVSFSAIFASAFLVLYFV